MNAYQLSEKELAQKMNTNLIQGLSSNEAKKRFHKYGPNSFPEPTPHSIFTIILHQFKSPLIYVLFAAALITIFLNKWLDTGIILTVIIINTIIGTIQEGRTQHIISSLQKMLKTDSIVIRDGTQSVISDDQLVPGDIIVIQEGMRIPADVRLIQARNLQIDEAILTGESKAVKKDCTQIKEERRIYEQCNMAFQGTYVMSGGAQALVIATGSNTQIGQLHKTITSISTDFPLKAEIDTVARWILAIVSLCIVILSILGYALKIELYELLITLTAIFVSAIPEGLPVIVTFILARGAYIMAKKNFLIKKLQAVEALGRTSVVLIDKTGTITHNEMMVVNAYTQGKWYTITGAGYEKQGDFLHDNKPITQEDRNTLETMAYSTLISKTQVYFDDTLKLYRVKGNQTEAAMIVFSKKLGLDRDDMLKKFKILYEQPFDKEKRYNFGCYAHKDQMICYMTGSPETILKYSKNGKKEGFKAMDVMLEQGLRVIGVARFEHPLKNAPENINEFPAFIKTHFDHIKFVGLFGMQDAVRPSVKASVEEARGLGVSIAMVTGDHKETAKHIAQQVNIYRKGDEVITGKEFIAMSQRERTQKAPNTTVYARFIPQEKYELVNTYHKLGHTVAMTGDGVNDAPSLAAADIGIAMGIMGTEVAKQATDAILLDDSFTSIVDGIYEGRNVFYTLRRVILYYFTTNLGELLTIMTALLLQFPLPLLATQILWINIITDGFMDFGLAFEPPNRKLLQYHSVLKKHLIDYHFIMKTIVGAITMLVGSLSVFAYALPYGLDYARTMIVTTLLIFQWFNAWNCRSEWTSIFRMGLFRNKILVAITIFLVSLQLMVDYIPFFSAMLRLIPLSLNDWLICTAVASSIVIIEETRKYFTEKPAQDDA
jgi:P-type Ca2+ transporter type 2C